MIESVKIQNFRCFSELEVQGLKPINIIVGENASGKTAFLETVLLSSAAVPQTIFHFREMRQLGTLLELGADSVSYWNLWEDIFHAFDLTKPISIEVTGPGSSRVLVVSRAMDSIQIVPFGNRQNPFSTYPYPLLSFEWSPNGGDTVRVIPRINGNSIVYDGGSTKYFPTLSFWPHIPDSPQDVAKRFSELSKDGNHEPVIDALREEFPFLKTLSLEINSGVTMVFAAMESHNRKFPIGLISGGVNKLLSILVGIASHANGTVLIDQFEDGFYFKKLPSIWKTIHKFAKENGTQLFATTHSQECLNALLPVLEANEEDFALVRASRLNNVPTLRVIDGKGFSSALSQEFELR